MALLFADLLTLARIARGATFKGTVWSCTGLLVSVCFSFRLLFTLACQVVGPTLKVLPSVDWFLLFLALPSVESFRRLALQVFGYLTANLALGFSRWSRHSLIHWHSEVCWHRTAFL